MGVRCACGRPKAMNKTECRWCIAADVARHSRPCAHGNNMGLHGRVVCVDCGGVLRQMTPAERAADPTFRTVVDPWAAQRVHELLDKDPER